MHYVVGAIVGFIVGIFTPGVTKKLKSLFSAEVKKGVSIAEAEAKAGEADVKAEAAKVEKKL
jgi:hypothetical protein